MNRYITDSLHRKLLMLDTLDGERDSHHDLFENYTNYKYLIVGPSKSGKTSLLFEYAFQAVDNDLNVLYITQKQIEKLPHFLGTRVQPSSQLLKKIDIVYPKSNQECIEFLDTAHAGIGRQHKTTDLKLDNKDGKHNTKNWNRTEKNLKETFHEFSTNKEKTARSDNNNTMQGTHANNNNTMQGTHADNNNTMQGTHADNNNTMQGTHADNSHTRETMYENNSNKGDATHVTRDKSETVHGENTGSHSKNSGSHSKNSKEVKLYHVIILDDLHTFLADTKKNELIKYTSKLVTILIDTASFYSQHTGVDTMLLLSVDADSMVYRKTSDVVDMFIHNKINIYRHHSRVGFSLKSETKVLSLVQNSNIDLSVTNIHAKFNEEENRIQLSC